MTRPPLKTAWFATGIPQGMRLLAGRLWAAGDPAKRDAFRTARLRDLEDRLSEVWKSLRRLDDGPVARARAEQDETRNNAAALELYLEGEFLRHHHPAPPETADPQAGLAPEGEKGESR